MEIKVTLKITVVKWQKIQRLNKFNDNLNWDFERKITFRLQINFNATLLTKGKSKTYHWIAVEKMFSCIVTLPIFSSFQCKLSVGIQYKTKFTKNVSQSLGASGPQAVENLWELFWVLSLYTIIWSQKL